MDMFPLIRGESISFESYSSNCHAQTGCANLFSQPKVAPDLTLVLRNFLRVFLIHLKLELLTQYPASNEMKEK